ncbi:hypothetical protein NIES593_07040 [Hydrococcus rivularis NIES-593]|uniref:GDSL family lipase n=1 Tax=Hydrococcus rivularis NIES-593 TaxID=1921803 RepID=A0A1U7HLK4_9CYAN|nr:SGNH/GDSL hydrolase family protein [Hydrococcus rivularis]OKH24431.1 hypothetical protein NIES593_07040 [Hydrococcus rivularis NIES-593]
MPENNSDNLTGLGSNEPLVGLASSETNGIDDLYVFGDSLSDIGNTFNLVGGPPSPPYFNGRFTNGPTWVEILAQNVGVDDLTASTDLSVTGSFDGKTIDRSVNFAYGGTETEGNTGSRGLLPTVVDQVAQFTQDHDRFQKSADANDLFVIWGGANDYFFDSSAKPKDVVDNITDSIESLYRRGGRDFLIPNLPDLGRTPGALTGGDVFGEKIVRSSKELTKISNRHNSLLAKNLDKLEKKLPDDVDITLFDVNSLFDRAIAEPQRFGLTVVDRPFLSVDPASGANPDQYLFWDNVHPTATIHRVLGEAASSIL